MDEIKALKRIIFEKQLMIMITTVFGIFEAVCLLTGLLTGNVTLILIGGSFLLWMAHNAAKDQRLVEGARELLKDKGG
jgi:hypothetical protein